MITIPALLLSGCLAALGIQVEAYRRVCDVYSSTLIEKKSSRLRSVIRLEPKLCRFRKNIRASTWFGD